MGLKSIQTVIVDLANLDAVNHEFTNFQRAMNSLSAAVRSLSDDRREIVTKEIKETVIDWLTSGMPDIAIPAPAPVHMTPKKTTNAPGKRSYFGFGPGPAIVRFLTMHGPATASQVIKGVSGKFQTASKNETVAIRQTLATLKKGKYARLKREDGLYRVLPGRELSD